MAADRARRELIRAAKSILRPLVRQLIARGVTFPAFARLAKEVYIDVATKHFALPFKRQTDSRVALVTGITRKEIGQVRRGKEPAGDPVALGLGLATRVIGRWTSDDHYLDSNGRPRTLTYDDPSFGATFVDLVANLGGDIPPRAVLDELIRVGAVSLSTRGDVRLQQQAYVPAEGTEEKLAILGRDVAELIAAIGHNIEHPGRDAFLQRKVFYDNVGAEALPELRPRVLAAGQDFLQAMNRMLAEYDRDRTPAAPGGSRTRAVVGLYYLEEKIETTEGAEDEKSTAPEGSDPSQPD
jgi:hypothetical protein